MQRRRLEADVKDKYIRQMASKGVRNKAEDKQGSGAITISWWVAICLLRSSGGGVIELVPVARVSPTAVDR